MPFNILLFLSCRPRHEITISTTDKPKLLSQVANFFEYNDFSFALKLVLWIKYGIPGWIEYCVSVIYIIYRLTNSVYIWGIWLLPSCLILLPVYWYLRGLASLVSQGFTLILKPLKVLRLYWNFSQIIYDALFSWLQCVLCTSIQSDNEILLGK